MYVSSSLPYPGDPAPPGRPALCRLSSSLSFSERDASPSPRQAAPLILSQGPHFLAPVPLSHHPMRGSKADLTEHPKKPLSAAPL